MSFLIPVEEAVPPVNLQHPSPLIIFLDIVAHRRHAGRFGRTLSKGLLAKHLRQQWPL